MVSFTALFLIVRDCLNQGLVIYRKSRSGFTRIATQIYADFFRAFPRVDPREAKRSASINKGFSLIELLIAITVITILAGIVVVAFGPARKQAKDARIISDLYQLQNLAENIYLNEGDYSSLDCTAGSPEVAALCDDVTNQGSSLYINSVPESYCASVELGPSMTRTFCVDYLGFAGEITATVVSPCFLRSFCSYNLCPDFNNNKVVDCGLDPPGSINDPITDYDTCYYLGNNQNDPRFTSGDLGCIVKCYGNPPAVDEPGPGCAPAPCVSCETSEECLFYYDVDRGGFVTIPDVIATTKSIGQKCQ